MDSLPQSTMQYNCALVANFETSMNDRVNLKAAIMPIYESHSAPWSVFNTLRNEESCDYSHISLFSGCGGFDLGFRQAGFKTEFACDIDKDACSTYKENLGDILECDLRIAKLPCSNFTPDVLTAGFPCQPFSNAGLRKGVNDSRGTLFQTAIDVVKQLEPKVVLFENVRGLLSFKHENGLLIEYICEQLDNLGYDVVFSLINASHHNVPQRRLRVFIVGVSRKENIGKFSFPDPVERNDLTLSHTIFDLTNDVPNQDELMQLNPQAIRIGSMVPEGGSWKDIPYDKMPLRLQKIWDNLEHYRWPNFYRRFHRDEIAGTITAAFKPENAGVWHPTKERIFSVREIARIQTFPDWFIFKGRTIKSKYHQIGNAVPPRLAYEIAVRIRSVLKGADLRSANNGLDFKDFLTFGRPLRARDRNVIYNNLLEIKKNVIEA